MLLKTRILFDFLYLFFYNALYSIKGKTDVRQNNLQADF